jgi:threonine dehydratase
LKAELLQKTGSFKPRGVLNRLQLLTPEERERGVITFSAGNHAQAVAWAASAAGIRATVVMPAQAPEGKVAAAQGYGAEVILHEHFVDYVLRLRDERGLTLVHPFDDPGIIAGAGTVGLEVLADLPDLATLVVGIGGGGLISGMAVAVRTQRPAVRIIGVEPLGANAMFRSLAVGHPVRLDTLNTIADGLAPPYAGEHTYAIVRELVDEVLVIPDEEILEGMRFLFERCKLVAEPAGAAATGALLAGRVRAADGPLVAVVSGGNIDVARMKSLL